MKFKTFEFWILNLGVIALGLFMLSRPAYAAVLYDTFSNVPVSTSTLSSHYKGEGGGTNYSSVYGGAPGAPTLQFCESGDPSGLSMPFFASVWANATSSGASLSVPSGMSVSTTTEMGFIRTDYTGTVTKADFGNSICQFGSGGQWGIGFSEDGSRFVSGYGENVGTTGWSTINSWGEGISPAFYYSNEQAYQASPTISLSFPSSSVSSDFSNWVVSVNNPPSAAWYPGVEYNQQFVSRPTSTDYLFQSLNPSSLSVIPIPKSSNLGNTTWSQTLYWSARPFIQIMGSTTRIYGDWVDFSINNGVGYPTSTPVTQAAGPFNSSIWNPNLSSTTLASSSLSNAFDVDCSAYDNASFLSSSTIAAIGCNIRQSFGWILGQLIYPHDTIKNYFNWSLSILSNGFPFNFVFETVETTKNVIENASSASSSLSIYLPMAGNIDVLTPTTLEDIFGTSTAATIRTIESSLLWIGVVVAVISMIL